jgi:hypothetical protein
MAITDALIHYRRFLKRRNHSACTVRNYMSTLNGFVLWLDTPIEDASCKKWNRRIATGRLLLHVNNDFATTLNTQPATRNVNTLRTGCSHRGGRAPTPLP